MSVFPESASRIHGYLARHRRLEYISLEASSLSFSGTSSFFLSKRPALLLPELFSAPLEILLFPFLGAQHHGRKPQVKYRTTLSISPILSPNAPPMSFNEAPADSQAQTNSAAAPFVTTLYLIKAIEDTPGKVRRDAWPIIAYMQGKSGSFFRLL